MTASLGVCLLDTRYFFTHWLEYMIAYSIKYFHWYIHLWLIWSTLYIVNTVIYYIWWSYIVFQRNYIGWHISVSIISNRNYSFHFFYTLYVLLMYTSLLQIPLHYSKSPVEYQLLTFIFQSPLWPTNHQSWEILLWIYLQF